MVGFAEIAPGEAIGIAQAPLVEIPMSDVSLWDGNDELFVGNIVGVTMGKVSTPRDESKKLFFGIRDSALTNDSAYPPSALLS